MSKILLDELVGSELYKDSPGKGIGQHKEHKDIGLLVWPYCGYLSMNFGDLCRSKLKCLLHFSARHYYPSSRGSRKGDIPFSQLQRSQPGVFTETAVSLSIWAVTPGCVGRQQRIITS